MPSMTTPKKGLRASKTFYCAFVIINSSTSNMGIQPRPVADQTLRDLYDLLKWAPTSANAAPARFAFLRSKEVKERLRPALAPGNVEKTMTAPVTVIVA